jgi:hypothetical protein
MGWEFPRFLSLFRVNILPLTLKSVEPRGAPMPDECPLPQVKPHLRLPIPADLAMPERTEIHQISLSATQEEQVRDGNPALQYRPY